MLHTIVYDILSFVVDDVLSDLESEFMRHSVYTNTIVYAVSYDILY